jgi:tyrosyl-tRNA synthetase
MELIKRGTVEIVPENELREKLKKAQAEGRRLRIKYGLDPTAPDIHLGHAVPLRKLRQFQDLGHEVVIIIGDFTARIGDPSGKSETRPQLTTEQVKANAKTYQQQYSKILDPEKTTVTYNNDWLGKLTMAEIIKITAKLTVARTLERDDFQKRLGDGRPIGLHELLYPVCQAYDSVELKADVELGGTEQKFNILMARDLQGAYGQEAQVALMVPILPGLDGVQKMSKSLGNYVGITEPAYDMFAKIMSISDDVMPTFYELCTDVPMGEIRAMMEGIKTGTHHPMDVKKRLAWEITKLYHTAAEADEAQAEWTRRFSELELPSDMPDIRLPADAFQEGKVWVVKLLTEAGMASTSSDARRLVQQGAVSIDGEKVTDIKAMLDLKDGQVLRAGKLRFGVIRL